MQLPGAFEKQAVGQLHDVGFVEDRHLAPLPISRVLEGKTGDALATDASCDLEALDHAGYDLVFQSRVEALGVLPDDDQVDVLVTGTDAGHGSDRSHGGVQAEVLAELDVHAGEAVTHRRRDRSLEGETVVLDGLQGLGRQHGAVLLRGGGPRREGLPCDARKGGVDHLLRRLGHLGPDSISRDHTDRSRHAPPSGPDAR